MSLEELQSILQNTEGTMEERTALVLQQVASTEKGAEFVAKVQENAAKSLYTLYMSAPKAKRSDALVAYGYRELCLMLDSFYGLKESHNIVSFNYLFLEAGLEKDLADPDAAIADGAINDLVGTWLDDGHSLFGGASYMAESNPTARLGISSMVRQAQGNYATAARRQYPEASLPYYEVGNTAYVTFDNFTISFDAEDGDNTILILKYNKMWNGFFVPAKPSGGRRCSASLTALRHRGGGKGAHRCCVLD